MSARVSELKKEDFYFPVLKHLDALGGSAGIEELDAAIIAEWGFTDEEQSAAYETSGALMIPDKISWGRSRLKMAGLLTSGGPGIWVLTDAGRAALQQGDQAVRQIVKAAEQRYQREYQAKKKATQSGQQDMQDSAKSSEESPEEAWSDLLLAKVKQMEPAAFERLSQRILRESGFTSVKVTGKSGRSA